jgi:hypothetical protein
MNVRSRVLPSGSGALLDTWRQQHGPEAQRQQALAARAGDWGGPGYGRLQQLSGNGGRALRGYMAASNDRLVADLNSMMGDMSGNAEVRMGLRNRRVGRCQTRACLAHCQHMLAGRSFLRPIAHRIEIERLDALALGHDRLGQCAVGAIHHPQHIGRAGGFRRSYDATVLVDPDRLRHVHQVEQVGDMMITVDQAGIGRFGRLDPGSC